MGTRTFSFADRLIGEIDKAINVLCSPAHSARPLPGSPGAEWAPDEADRRQALTARNEANAETMRQAADEEADHLAWCEIRIKELKGRTSVLNPLWYAGSFLIGAAAGLSGERTGLGFITETERQVESHLRGHLDRLPAADLQSRAIIEQMTHDEIRHGAKAASLGGREPPIWIKGAMHLASRVMTGGSRWA
jgi:ubiquinone biosynthesis monooxygenase Coq7